MLCLQRIQCYTVPHCTVLSLCYRHHTVSYIVSALYIFSTIPSSINSIALLFILMNIIASIVSLCNLFLNAVCTYFCLLNARSTDASLGLICRYANAITDNSLLSSNPLRLIQYDSASLYSLPVCDCDSSGVLWNGSLVCWYLLYWFL